jgi:uncharacterized membrane protein
MADPNDSSTPSETVTTTPESGSSGLDPKIAAGVAAIFPLIGGIIFLLIEKKNAYVRFYAMQSVVFAVACILFNIAVTILMVIFGGIPLIGKLMGLLFWLASLGIFVIYVIAIIKAFSGVEWEIPYLGKIARKYLKSSAI